jgi:hypothetical protein
MSTFVDIYRRFSTFSTFFDVFQHFLMFFDVFLTNENALKFAGVNVPRRDAFSLPAVKS